jgi:RNA polymerase sigma-70 factor (ECF subfamily)
MSAARQPPISNSAPTPSDAMETAELELELARLHADSYGWALACCGRDVDDAEEVLQATYLKVLSGKARFGGRSSLRTWLFGVIRRTAAEERRRGFLRRLSLGRYAMLVHPEPSPAPDAAIEQAQRINGLTRALRALAPRQREVLQLVFYHDMTIEQAAEVMSVSLGTARTHYERGKARLVHRLNGERP